jgi:hypothetical protein
MNNGVIFGITYHGVRRLPRRVSYAIGHVGSSLVARWAPQSTAALVDNLRPIRDTTKTCFLAVYYRFLERL